MVGSHRLFEERGMCAAGVEAALEQLAHKGRSTVIVAEGGVADRRHWRRRRSAGGGARYGELLREYGIEHVVLLTGDHEAAARALAESRRSR